MATAKDKSGATDKITLGVTGPEDYDGSEVPVFLRKRDKHTPITCPACGLEATWDPAKMGKGWRCPKGHLTRPGQ